MKKIILICLLLISLTACDNTYIDKNVEVEDVNKKLEEIESDENEDYNENNNDIASTVVDSTENLEQNSSGDIEIELIPTVSPSANLSNKTCAWGFRRMGTGERPEFSKSYTDPLDAYEGIYCGSSEEKVIYLTFDEGYENGYTGQILDTLKEKDVKAAFFVTMSYVKQNPELIKRIIDEGHVLGNHSNTHPSMPSVTDDEKLKKEVTVLHEYIKENYNYEMTFFRPPKGEYSERTVKLCKDLGYVNVLWSSAYDDWDVNKQDRLDYGRKMILNYVHNGCVMLLHAVSKDNTALLGEVIDKLRTDGYEFKSLEEFEY